MPEEVEKILKAFDVVDFSDEYISKIDYETIQSILKLSVHKTYKKGDIILSLDDECENLGFLLSGSVRSYYIDSNGNDLTKNFYLENDFFLDEVLFGYKKSICIYEALQDSEMVFLNAKLLKKIIYSNEWLSKLYIQCLEHGLRYKVDRENSFLMNSAKQRYIDFRKKYPNLETRVRQSHIATYLGIKPESLSRIRKNFKENL